MKRIQTLIAFALALGLPLLALASNQHYEGASLGFMPEVVSESGRKTDHLYSFIMVIVMVMFVITEGMLLISLFLFRDRPGHKAHFTHGSTKVEIVLAVIPALILAYVTVQSGLFWHDLKLAGPKDKDVLHVQVLGEQFSWNFRYAGPDAVFGTDDDVTALETAPLPVNRTVVFHISSKDVIHSFFVPEARGKQDAVPGLQTRMWFKVDRLPVWNMKTGKRELFDEKEYAGLEVGVSGYAFMSRSTTAEGLPLPKITSFQISDSAKIGVKDYYYEKNGEPVQVLKAGKPVRAPGEPEYLRHYYEIGCAQLCGNLHFAMRGMTLMLPGAEFDAWIKSQGPDAGLNELWHKAWDGPHPDFNRI